MGSQDTQLLAKTAQKVSLSHPFLCAHQMLGKTRTWEQCPHIQEDKAREKWQIDSTLPRDGVGGEGGGGRQKDAEKAVSSEDHMLSPTPNNRFP